MHKNLKDYFLEKYEIYNKENIILLVSEDGVLNSGFPESLRYTNEEVTKKYKKNSLLNALYKKALFIKNNNKNFLIVPIKKKYNSKKYDFSESLIIEKIKLIYKKENIDSFYISNDNLRDIDIKFLIEKLKNEKITLNVI